MNELKQKPDEVVDESATEAQADDDAAPEPDEAAQPAAPPQEPPPPPPIAAAPPEPAKPPELTDDECTEILERAGRDVVEVWNETITAPLIAAAKGKVTASSFGADSKPGVFNPEIHFTNSLAGEAGWAQRIDYEIGVEDGRFRDCRRISDSNGCVRSVLRLRDKLCDFAALPVRMKSGLGGRRESAVQAANNVAMGQVMAAQHPELSGAARLATYRRAGMTLTPTSDGEDIIVTGHQHQQQLDQIKAEKPLLLAALKAETKVII